MNPVVAFEGGTARSGRAFIALAITGIIKVKAASALQEIAADRRHIANLRRCSRQQCLRQNRILLADQGMGGNGGIPSHGADSDTFAVPLDARQLNPRQVDQVAGCSTPIFIRSIRLVPPPINLLSLLAPIEVKASATDDARL